MKINTFPGRVHKFLFLSMLAGIALPYLRESQQKVPKDD